MNIYNDDLQLDPDKAAAELRGLPQVSNKDAKREGYVHLQTAALIDIADSLRTLAVEAAISMADAGHLDHLDSVPDEGVSGFAVVDAPAGARVIVAEGDGVGFNSSTREGVLTGESGTTEGAGWVGVLFPGDTQARRVWVERVLEFVSSGNGEGDDIAHAHAEHELAGLGDRGPDGVDVAALSIAGLVEEWEAPVPDPIDADFEGDEHGRAEAAVKALKARERAAKKGKK